MKRLYAGPWIGEFGWELMGWQGVIRYLAPDFDKVIIIGQKGHGFLYEDFATDYLEHGLGGSNPNMWMNDSSTISNPLRNKGDVWITPQQLTLMNNPPQQTFIKYGTQSQEKAYDIVCHARSIKKYESDYINYPVENWVKLLGKDKKVASIGTIDGAYHIPGTDDLRGISLEELTNVLASSKLLVGPSSGPIHLGSLCGIPHLVWSGYERSKIRYEQVWNPLKTPVKVISPDGDPWGKKEEWQPDIDILTESIKRML